MNYIKLGRVLDTNMKEASHNEVENMPDDILNLILDYTGVLTSKSTSIYYIKFETKAEYRSYNWNTDLEKYVDDTVKLVTMNSFCYWCDHCHRFFRTKPETHYNTKTHKEKCKKSKLCKHHDFLIKAYRHLYKRYLYTKYFVKDITKIHFKQEVFTGYFSHYGYIK